MRLATPSLVGGNGVRYPFRGQGLRMVFSNPNFATAFDTEGSEPYGLLRLLKRVPDTVSPTPFLLHRFSQFAVPMWGDWLYTTLDRGSKPNTATRSAGRSCLREVGSNATRFQAL